MAFIPAKRICVIRLSALGDAVHALALVNGLKKGYPDAHITWILQQLPYEMVQHQPNIDEFILFDRKGGSKAFFNLARTLKKREFDLVLVPQVSLKASAITALTRSKNKLGFDFNRSRELHWLFTNRSIPYHEPQHVQDQFLEFLAYLGITDPNPEWNITFTDEEIAYRKNFFRKIARPVVAFVVASSHPDKDWTIDGYAKVMDRVDQQLNAQPMIVGGPSPREKDLANAIVNTCTTRPIIALEKPVRHTLLQLAGSHVVVSPDTGPLHAAIAMNVPTVGLYGFSNPRRCGPYKKFQDLLIDQYTDPGEEHTRIRRKTKKGRMALITWESVFTKIELALTRYAPPHAEVPY